MTARVLTDAEWQDAMKGLIGGELWDALLQERATLREAICGLDWRDWVLLAEHAERQPNIQENVVEALRRLAQVRRELGQ